jgi:hypothetical protein
MSEGLHFIKSRTHGNVKSIVEGIVIRVADSLGRFHDFNSSLTFAEGVSDRLLLGGATTMPDVDLLESLQASALCGAFLKRI